MTRVTFATPGVLAMLRERQGTVYGGSELRAWRFARGLADNGFGVSIIGFDNDPVSSEALGPVSILTAPSPSPWVARLNRVLGRGRALQSAPWRKADGDVYVAFGAAEYNADLAEWCKLAGRPLLLIAGSDADFSEDYRPGNTARNLWGSRCDRCYDSIRLATRLVVQTEHQKRLAKELFGCDADIIANPIAIPAGEQREAIGDRFLWIGKAVDNKRPELALEVARACPEQSFLMILNDVGNGLFAKISAMKPPNVDIIASVPPSGMQHYFDQTRALLCTSDFEGFPNTFLDAGKSGVPVISLSVDPDGMIAREQGGAIAQGDMQRLIEAVKQFAADPEAARGAGQRLFEYVKRMHDTAGRVAELAAIVEKMAAARQRMEKLA